MDLRSIDVEDVTRAVPNEHLRGDIQVKGIIGNRLELIGWAIGEVHPVSRIEVISQGEVIAATTTGVARQDLAEAFPGDPDAPTAGYEVALEAQSAGSSSLYVRAVLGEATHAPLGHLRVVARPDQI